MPSNWESLDAPLRESVQHNVEIYERVRPALKLVTRDVLLTLRGMLKDSEVTPLFVTGRTKTVESFKEKISRTEEPLEPGGRRLLKFPDPFRTLNDMVGIRVITKLPAENAAVANIIKRQRQVFDCRGDREKDIGSIESGTYGYSSRHLILRSIQNEAVKEYQQVFNPDVQPNGSYFFECQIRTIFAHAWSEIEHDIRFKAEDPRAWTPHFDRQFTATVKERALGAEVSKALNPARGPQRKTKLPGSWPLAATISTGTVSLSRAESLAACRLATCSGNLKAADRARNVAGGAGVRHSTPENVRAGIIFRCTSPPPLGYQPQRSRVSPTVIPNAARAGRKTWLR